MLLRHQPRARALREPLTQEPSELFGNKEVRAAHAKARDPVVQALELVLDAELKLELDLARELDRQA